MYRNKILFSTIRFFEIDTNLPCVKAHLQGMAILKELNILFNSSKTINSLLDLKFPFQNKTRQFQKSKTPKS